MTTARCLAAIRNARALVFDFDGTLVASNDIKWRGFEVAFAEFPEQLADIMAYCRAHNHTVRSEKFQHVYEQILCRPYTPEIARTLQERFAAATTEAIVNAPEIPGATSFLRGLVGRHTSALLSSTPHWILLDILDRRRMRGYFDLVQGAPVNKAAWLEALRTGHTLTEAQTVFFGDTAEDMAAARLAGCTFIAVGPGIEPADEHYAVSDFLDLDV